MTMRVLILVLAMALATIHPVRADEVADAKTIIGAQADAFARDDATGAYGYAAPLVQQIFPKVDLFMDMVRSGYAPVYRHKSFEFGRSAMDDGKVTQIVHIVDADGVPWEALYTLERQSDGTLKISGCTLLKVGQSV